MPQRNYVAFHINIFLGVSIIMADKLIPHTANALTVGLTDKPGNNEYLAASQKALSQMVEEAPKDGKLYARQDGKWVEITKA